MPSFAEDEEVQYVMLELPLAVPAELVRPGKEIRLLVGFCCACCVTAHGHVSCSPRSVKGRCKLLYSAEVL